MSMTTMEVVKLEWEVLVEYSNILWVKVLMLQSNKKKSRLVMYVFYKVSNCTLYSLQTSLISNLPRFRNVLKLEHDNVLFITEYIVG